MWSLRQCMHQQTSVVSKLYLFSPWLSLCSYSKSHPRSELRGRLHLTFSVRGKRKSILHNWTLFPFPRFFENFSSLPLTSHGESEMVPPMMIQCLRQKLLTELIAGRQNVDLRSSLDSSSHFPLRCEPHNSRRRKPYTRPPNSPRHPPKRSPDELGSSDGTFMAHRKLQRCLLMTIEEFCHLTILFGKLDAERSKVDFADRRNLTISQKSKIGTSMMIVESSARSEVEQ